MDVSDYKFSENEILNLQQYRDNQPDVRLKVRFMALLLLGQGLEYKGVASVIGKSTKTIENWHHQYITKGIDSLNSFQYRNVSIKMRHLGQIIKLPHLQMICVNYFPFGDN